MIKSVSEMAHELVGGDRRGDYGHPLDDFCRTAVLWSAILKIKVTFKEVALCMIQVKQSREVNKEKQDNMTDTCGYAECLDMCYVERNRRIKEGWTFDELTGVWNKAKLVKTIEDLLKDGPPNRGTIVNDKHNWKEQQVNEPYPLPHYPYTGDPLPGQESTVIYKKTVNCGSGLTGE